MNPGRALDALIAEKVMGWEKADNGYWIDLDCHRALVSEWKPSTDIKSAWEVVEKAGITALIKMSDGKWMARIDDLAIYDSYYERPTAEDLIYEALSFGETVPHAICLAALKAVGCEANDQPSEGSKGENGI